MKAIKKLLVIFAIFLLNLNCTFALEKDMSVNTLPSGQKVIVKEIHDNNIVKIDTWINTGSINEDNKTNGISHFLEHLFFKGTQKNPTGTFDKILDSKGATVNAATSKDYTHYYIEIPSADFDLALDLHADMLLNPMIPRKELERERPVVIEEISKTKDSPANRMFDNLYTLIYEKSNHPYKRTVIGKKEIIQNVTREEILNYYNKFYTPDAFTTVIVGDVNSAQALKKVENAFNNNNPKNQNSQNSLNSDKNQKNKPKQTGQTTKSPLYSKQVKIKYPKVKPLTGIEEKIDTMDVNKTHLMIGFLAPKFSDDKETYPLDVLSTILTTGKSSILNQKIKEEKDLVRSISSGNYSQKDSGIFYIYATIDPQREKQAKDEIIKEIKKIQQGILSDSAVSKAKNQIKTDTYYARESISNIAEELGYSYTFSSGNENYYDNYLKNIEKVTKQDIINAANKYLTTDKYALSIVRGNNFKEISDVKKDSNSDCTNNKLIEQKENTKKVLLENGANLITKKKTTNSIIAFDISIKGSKAIEKVPASALLAAAAATHGSENYTNTQFAQFLDENGIKLGVASSNDVFSISMQVTKNNLDKAFIVLDEVLNKPVFPDSEIEKIKTRKIKDLKSISDTPSRFVFDEFKKLAFKDTIYGQNSTFILNNIEKAKREDIVDFYSRVINPCNMSISVVGDVDEDFVAQKFNEIIKPCDKENCSKFSFKTQKFTPYKPQNNIETTIYKNEVQANWLALGYKTCGTLSEKDRKDIAVLNVINAILGEGMSSRLFTKLREEKGLAYSVGSNLSANILDGVFMAYIGTNSNGIEQAKQGILDEFEILKKEMVTTQELNDAKNKIMGQFLFSLETNMAEADLLSSYDVLGRNLDALEEYKKLILKTTQSDIIETANRYFSQPYIYTVVKEKPQQGKN